MTGKKMFGTNGVRGVINETMTVDLVLKLGKAIGTVIGPGKIVIGRDARNGGEMFSNTVIAGLLSTGCSIVNIGPVPTPTLQFVVPRMRAAGGVVITASHNPAEFNGIKVMGGNGIEISRETERKIESIFHSCNFTVANWDALASVTHDETAVDQHIEGIKSHINTEIVRTRNLVVVIDSANSVGGLVTPKLMRDLGCKVVSLNSQLDGSFPGRSPEPTPENVIELRKTVKSIGADLGIAHDGDADRATFVDEDGNTISGDHSLAIIAKRVLNRRTGSTLVTPISSGKLIEDIVEEVGGKIDWTVVGSVDVSHRVEEINAELGGEENGGVFYPPHQAVRDGPMTSALIVEIMSSENKKLSELVSELPVYYTEKQKLNIPIEKMNSIAEKLLILTEDQRRITIDGIKLIQDDGWILIRPSGTEPLYRIFAEGRTQETAKNLCKFGIDLIQRAMK
ncbi:phosphoglucosamine mutase [Candidatus Thorarchaeota archaeon]|nr:MAG: phosphoglucosamine mutase [Candidatus Thorarchaeota archaeon]